MRYLVPKALAKAHPHQRVGFLRSGAAGASSLSRSLAQLGECPYRAGAGSPSGLTLFLKN